jgi:hypothetical protein
MFGRHLRQSEYALRHVVVSFRELLSRLAKARLTHTYRNISLFCELVNLGYLVFRYGNTEDRPFTEWAKQWLHDREVYSPWRTEMETGEGLVRCTLS